MTIDERPLRVADVARGVGADWALLTSPDAVFYATQHAYTIEWGPSPFTGGPTAAFVSADGSTVGLLVNNLEEAGARSSAATWVFPYVGLALDALDPVQDRYQRAVDQAIDGLGVGGVVAVQAASLPERVAHSLAERGARLVFLDAEFERARATKTSAEIESLRRSARVVDAGQAAALKAVSAGRTELEAFADIREAMELAEGERLPVMGDLTSGIENTARISGWPTDRIMRDGDPVLCDLGPRVRGYWGDSCNTIVIGEPTDGFMNLYRTTQRALEVAAETLRPGISAADLDAAVRAVFDQAGLSSPIHIGHGIGTGPHEWPRIVPGAEAMIEPGMVLMVEPGAYDEELGGVRLEWMFLVTDTGNEVLSGFPHVLRG
jgi:Xaa-Pro aminopeptidase